MMPAHLTFLLRTACSEEANIALCRQQMLHSLENHRLVHECTAVVLQLATRYRKIGRHEAPSTTAQKHGACN